MYQNIFGLICSSQGHGEVQEQDLALVWHGGHGFPAAQLRAWRDKSGWGKWKNVLQIRSLLQNKIKWSADLGFFVSGVTNALIGFTGSSESLSFKSALFAILFILIIVELDVSLLKTVVA